MLHQHTLSTVRPGHRVGELIFQSLRTTMVILCAAHAADSDASTCHGPLNAATHAFGLPQHLLHAVATVESGRPRPVPASAGRQLRSPKMERNAWPWTINVGGQGYYFESREAAVSKVKELLKRGVRSIDVGCMQINLLHHPKAFSSIEEAFDPVKNTRYGAQFLRDLKRTHLSWDRAIAHYHSANPEHHTAYQKRVVRLWRNLQAGAYSSNATSTKQQTAAATVRRPTSSVHRWRPYAGWQPTVYSIPPAPAHLRPVRTNPLYQKLTGTTTPPPVAHSLHDTDATPGAPSPHDGLRFFPLRGRS